MKRPDVIAFVGPSLPAADVRRLARCTVLPPARQGDVWRAMLMRPRTIALVDGLFESQPSVWHREILDAMATGVAVFGGASMGALRAAELGGLGMVGVGEVFAAYRDGRLLDDGEVALLHAGPEDGWRPLTVPLVNVRAAAERARDSGLLSIPEAGALVRAAERIFYMDRTWPRLLDAAARRWRPGARERWSRFAAAGLPDVKAEDARATVAAASAFARSAPRGGFAAPLPPASSLVRRRKIADSPVPLAGTSFRPGLARDGLRRALLAGLARSLGLVPPPGALADAADGWIREAGATPRTRTALLRRLGLDEADAARIAEEAALERVVLSEAARIVPDGPSPLEGLVAEARRRGLAGTARRGRARGARRR